MIPPLNKWYPMVEAYGYPDRIVASNKRAERLQAEYDTALKFKKLKDKVDELEVELYNKKAQQNVLQLEVFHTRKLDLYA
jgi:hypothetical protein